MLFQWLFVFLNLLGFDVNSCQWNFNLHCCHPVTTFICHSGYILIKGHRYMTLTRLPLKISPESGSDDNGISSGFHCITSNVFKYYLNRTFFTKNSHHCTFSLTLTTVLWAGLHCQDCMGATNKTKKYT